MPFFGYNLVSFSSLSLSEQAAWVQAIGSILAIGIAIAVPIYIDILNKRRVVKERKERSKILALSILRDLYALKVSTSYFLEESKNTTEILEIDELEGDYFQHLNKFQSFAEYATDLGLIGVNLSHLIYKLIQAVELLNWTARLQRGGHHQAYINNQDSFIEYAKEIHLIAEKIILMIDNIYDGNS